MRPVTSRLRAALERPHALAIRAELLAGGERVRDVAIDDGTVTLDQTAAARGRCDVALSDVPELVPSAPADDLAPYGNELRLSRGVRHYDGSTELIGLGVFRLQDVQVDDTGSDLTLRVAALDRSSRITDARFEEPWEVPAGMPIADAILWTLRAGWPDMPLGTWPGEGTTAGSAAVIGEEGGDRWQFCQGLAASFGHDLFFDGDGLATLVPTSTLSTGQPVADLVEGETGVLLTAARRWSRQGAFNRVIATSSNPAIDTVPPRGVATDENPLSPTYYYGAFGRVPRFYSSPFIASDQQAADAAAAMLARELGTTESVTFGALVLPYLEPGDVVRIRRDRAGLTDELHVIDSCTIPLTAAGTMSGATRAVQVT